jgi:iron-sulfur cluster repair protein YtfE (RIC family)
MSSLEELDHVVKEMHEGRHNEELGRLADGLFEAFNKVSPMAGASHWYRKEVMDFLTEAWSTVKRIAVKERQST